MPHERRIQVGSLVACLESATAPPRRYAGSDCAQSSLRSGSWHTEFAHVSVCLKHSTSANLCRQAMPIIIDLTVLSLPKKTSADRHSETRLR